MKGLSAKKHAKINRNRPQSAEKPERVNEKPKRSELEKDNQVNFIETIIELFHLWTIFEILFSYYIKHVRVQVMKQERHRPRTTVSTNSAAARSRNWQPSLQSISEAGS